MGQLWARMPSLKKPGIWTLRSVVGSSGNSAQLAECWPSTPKALVPPPVLHKAGMGGTHSSGGGGRKFKVILGFIVSA